MSAGARTTHPHWCRTSSCRVGAEPYARHRSRVVDVQPDRGERDTIVVYVVGDVRGGHTPTVVVESHIGPIATAGLMTARIGMTVRQSRVIGHLLGRVARRAS